MRQYPLPIVSNNINTTNSTPPLNRKSQSPFEQLINSSIIKINQMYRVEQLQEFNQLLSQQQPRKIKQLNIDPYIFILEYLFGKEQLVSFGLRQLNVIMDQNYYSSATLTCIIKLIGKCVQKYSSECVAIVLKIKQPSLQLFELFFEIYSTILLPEDIALQFRLLGYQWLIRIFRMKQTTIPLYFKHVIDKIGVFELPPLISTIEEQKQLYTYIHKIVNNLISKVEDRVELQLGSQAVVYRRRRKGKYLYCFMCQKPADYYCKDTKVPVCSSQCKKDHLLYIQSVNIVNQQFSEQFCRSIQQLLLRNWYCARSPSLSVDYLVAIYTFSHYQPKLEIQHCKIVKSPIMIQKVWLLYASYYEKKGELFEHIFISFLLSPNEYLQQVGKYYFLQISSTHRILQIYYNYDLRGNMRLFPMLFNSMLDDRDYCSIFMINLIEMIFQNVNSQYYFKLTPSDVTLSCTLVELFNESQMPIQSLQKYFPQQQMLSTDEQIALFLMKNETLIKKQRLTKLLDKDQQFIKSFLKQLTLKRAHSPIDQILRQIFYFINVNVSEKIYRLLELLYEVYEFESLGDQRERKVIRKDDALFQYMYLVVMINTELHSPNVQKRPTLGEVVDRVAIINKPLAIEQTHILESMYQRIKSLPFSQQTRGVLQHYQPYTFKMFKQQDFYLPLIILQNHQPIYETFTATFIPNAIIYRICHILTGFPQIQGMFFKMLLQRLEEQKQQDEYLLQAIRNIVQQQPNAVNIEGGWRIVFTYIKQSDFKRRKLQRLTSSSSQQGESIRRMDESSLTSPTLSSNEGEKRRRRIFQPFNPLSRSSITETHSPHTMIWLDLQSVIVASPLLTHDNFICFFKDFALTFSIQTYFRQYQKAIYLNRKRLNSMANGLMLSFRKMENYWMGMKMVEYIAGLEDVEIECENNKVGELVQSRIIVSKITNNNTTMSKIKSQLILLMLKQFPITDTTQPLILFTILSLSNISNFTITSQLWQCITHLALKFKSQQNQSIIEQMMKRCGQCDECYQSLMIQKTLNSTQPEMINKDVLTRLQKLQPYLNDLQQKVLKMFILKQNLLVIEKHISRFFNFVQTFTLFTQCIQSINNISLIQNFIVQRIQQAIQHQMNLQSILSQQFVDFIVAIIEIRQENRLQIVNLVVRYCDYLSLCVSIGSFEDKIMLDKSVIFYQASKQIYLLAVKLREKVKRQQIKNVKWVVEPIHMLTQFCQKLNSNVDYRRTLSQTYTFKHIVHFYQSETHSSYLIGLTKQFTQCKKLIWTINLSDPQLMTQAIEFISNQLDKLTLLYETIQSDVEDFDKCLSQILDQKTLDEIFVKLREKVQGFRAYLQFALQVLIEFKEIEFTNQELLEKTKLMWELSRNLLIKLLFNGVFVVEVRYPNSKITDKKLHPPHQTVKSQPFSNYLQTLGQASQHLIKLTQNIIKLGALSK